MNDENWKDRADAAGIVFTGEKQGVVDQASFTPEPMPIERTEVKIHRLEIIEHPNADALELAIPYECVEGTWILGGFRAIVPKGVYKSGDYALYIPEASVLPDELIEELGLVGRLSGSGKNRVKAIRLRGQLSQGIVCRPAAVNLAWEWVNDDTDPETLATESAFNWAETLGIVKWMPRMPAAFAGRVKVRGSSRILPWIEIPNVKKIMKDFAEGEFVYATEKIHGTHCMCTLDLTTDEFMVSSKGMGKQGWDLAEDDTNVYWKAMRQFHVEEWLREFHNKTNWGGNPPERIALYGEVFGRGIQDLDYGADLGYRAFDLRIDHEWMPTAMFYNMNEALWLLTGKGLPLAPILYAGPYDYTILCELAEGDSWVGGSHMREGVVVRPEVDRYRGDGTRVIAKFISEAYLLRKGNATEFE